MIGELESIKAGWVDGITWQKVYSIDMDESFIRINIPIGLINIDGRGSIMRWKHYNFDGALEWEMHGWWSNGDIHKTYDESRRTEEWE